MNNSHTLKSYDQQLSKLTESIVEMGGLVKQMIQNALKSLMEKDPALVDIAIVTDRKINELDQKIEQLATVVLALQNPMAVDLRFVTSALKVAGSLERAGDLAKNTTKRSMKMGNYALPAKMIPTLKSMVDIVVTMLDDALGAIADRNSQKAVAVWKQDDAVDELYHQILTSMQQEMLTDPNNILSCTHVVFAAKNFERIADYAASIAKTVYYVTSGEPPNKEALRAAMAAQQAASSN